MKVFTPKGEYLCTAERVTETHPMAKILGTVEDLEDYKQKIQKQQKLKRKTINSVKKLLMNDEMKFLECHSEFISESALQEPLNQVQDIKFKPHSNSLQTLFKNNSEKYEYLIKNDPDNPWISEFKKTKEYELLYA